MTTRKFSLSAALLAAAVALFTCEPVPDFCGRGEKYDPNCQFCFGGAAHDKCGGSGGKEYNPLIQGCVSDNNVEVGTRCQDYTVVPTGTPCGGWTLTTAAAPLAGGEVTRVPDEPHYRPGVQVILTAAPKDGYAFAGWAGTGADPASSADETKIIEMNANKPMVAMFKPIDKAGSTTRTLITTAFPEDGGNTTPSPSKSAYGIGETVTVTATANPGYEFVGWSGAKTSQDNPVALAMDNSQTLVAVFKPKVKKLTVNAVPSEGGAVYVNGAALSGIADQNAGTEIVVWAKEAEGWSFDGWSGSAAVEGKTDNPAIIPVTDDDMTIIARFRQGGGGGPAEQRPAVFTLLTSANYGGSVSLSPNDPEGAGYNIGTRVTATAVADSGYEFKGWSDAATGTLNPVTITMNENKTLVAEFAKLSSGGGDSIPAASTFTLIVGVNPTGGGSVTRNPDKPAYTSGERVTVTATAASGYTFDNWTGTAETGTANPLTVTMNANKTLTANFKSTAASTAPAAPTGVTATAASSSAITVSWSAVSGATEYYVYRSAAAAGTYSKAGTATATSFSNTGLSANTAYYYKVSAYNSAGESAQSAYASATTKAAAPTASPDLVFDLTEAKSSTYHGALWYAYTYPEGGKSTTTPASCDGWVCPYHVTFVNAGGKATLTASGTASDPYGAGIAFIWNKGTAEQLDLHWDDGKFTAGPKFTDGSGEQYNYNRDISAYTGVYVTYTLTTSPASGVDAYLVLNTEKVGGTATDNTLTGYNEYKTSIPKITTSTRTLFKFADFKQETGWGTTIAITTALKNSHGFDFKIADQNGSATFTITKIELTKDASSTPSTFTSASPSTIGWTNPYSTASVVNSSSSKFAGQIVLNSSNRIEVSASTAEKEAYDIQLAQSKFNYSYIGNTNTYILKITGTVTGGTVTFNAGVQSDDGEYTTYLFSSIDQELRVGTVNEQFLLYHTGATDRDPNARFYIDFGFPGNGKLVITSLEITRVQ